MTADRLPKILRLRARDAALTVPKRRRCTYCPKAATAECGCCCNEHVPSAISRATDGGPSMREYLASKGEL